MKTSLDARPVAGIFLLSLFLAGPLQAQEKVTEGSVAILSTRSWSADGKTPTGTIWRTFQTWRTDVVKTEKGELVNVDPLSPRGGRDDSGALVRVPINMAGWQYSKTYKKLEIFPAREVHGSPNPPEGWQGLEFDDQAWMRAPAPQRELYGLVALRCIRGKFEVVDPANAAEMSLTVRYRGGAVVYLNGREIGRANLPAGAIKPETMAEEYPREAYVTDDGFLIEQGVVWHTSDNKTPEELKSQRIETGLLQWNGNWRWHSISSDFATPKFFGSKSADAATRYQSRTRKIELKIPSSSLRKGLNVVAVEIHRAPAWEGMFTSPCYDTEGRKSNLAINSAEQFWDRSELEDIRLTGAGARSNVSAAAGLHVWNHPVDMEIDPSWYPDPSEPLQPVQIRGLCNGTYSGQLIVSSDSPIRGLKATIGDLKETGGGVIPATTVQIGYPKVADGFLASSKKAPEQWAIFDVLEPSAPAEIASTPWSMGRIFAPMQPVWFTVHIPKEAKPGKYKAQISIVTAAGATPASLEVEVIGGWALPDSTAFTPYVGFLECPDALAKFYNVPLWSDQHWKMLEAEYEQLAELGTKDVFIPLVAKTHLGNPNSMVRWIKQADGAYKVDTSIAEKYVDLCIKHLGKIPAVCLYTSTRSQYGFNTAVDQPICSEYNPGTNTYTDFKPPKFGTAESRAFWKPVIDEMSGILSKRGLGEAMMFGYLADGPGPDEKGKADGVPKHFSDFREISPKTKWMVSTHWPPRSWRAGEYKGVDFLGSLSYMHATLFNVHWFDDGDSKVWKPSYGWRDKMVPLMVLAASRSRSPTLDNDHCQNVTRWRTFPEALLMSQKDGYTYQGFGSWGADFWANEWQRFDPYGNVALSESTALWLIGPGAEGPVPTCRGRMLKEGLQEAQTRIYVQNALLDDSQKLGADLAGRLKSLCDDRTRDYTYMTRFRYNDGETSMPRMTIVPDLAAWAENTVKLDRIAGEVAAVLKK